MATGLTNFGDLTPTIRDSMVRVLLKRAMKDQVFMQFASKAVKELHNGDRIIYKGYDSYPVATTAFTDGIVNAPRKPTFRQPTAQLERYGDHTKLTRQAIKTNLEDVTAEITSIHGQQAGETIDTLMREVIYSGVSSVNCTNGVNGGTPTELTFADIQAFVKTLRKNSAHMIEDPIPASTKVSTAPVSRAFIMFVHTDLRDEVRELDTFVPVHQYSNVKGAYPNELGAVYDVRIIETNNGKLSGGTYSNFIFGMDAYTALHLSSENVNVYRHGFGSAGTEDPYSQFLTIAWDVNWAGLITNDNWIGDLRSTAK